MGRKRNGGLGRGLDALIPMMRVNKPVKEDSSGKEQELSLKKSPENVREESSKSLQEMSPEGDQEGSSKNNREMIPPGSPEESGRSTGESPQEFRENISSESPQAPEGSPDAYSKFFRKEYSETQGSDNTQLSSDQGKTFQSGASRLENEGAVQMLRLSQVDPNRSQPRGRFEEESLEELADSIRQFGVLQPILVQRKGGRYEIIAGERRWRASRKAGLKEIPALVRDYSDEEAVELSLIENIQREDLNPIEEAKAFRRLLDEFGLRQEDLAERVSKSRTAITNALRLLKLDERVQAMVVEEKLSMGHARALIPVEIPEEQFLLAQEIAEKMLSVREVEKLVKKRSAGKAGTGENDTRTSGKDAVRKRDPALELAYRAIEERLKQSLGTKATIRHGGDGAGKLEIEFYSSDDLEKIVDMLTV